MQAPTVSDPTVELTPTVTETPAPQSGETPSAPTTAEAAAKSGDAKAFRELRHQERVDALKGTTKTVPVKAHERTVTEKPKTETEKPKKNIDTRIQQLDAETASKRAILEEKLRVRAEVDRQLKALDRQPAADAPKEAPKPKKSNWADHPDAPKLDEFPDYETYLDARAEFIADRKLEARLSERDSQSEAQQRIQSQFTRVQASAQTFKERVTDWRKTNPDAQIDDGLLDVAPMSALQAINATLPEAERIPLQPENFLAEQIFQSEAPGALAHYLSTHPDERQRLHALCYQDPGAVVRQIGAIEAEIKLQKASPATSPRARVSTVPNPPTVLSGKTADLDPIRAAAKNGDARTYRALRHQERVAQFGRR